MHEDAPDANLKTTELSFEILHYLQDNGVSGISEIAEGVGSAESTVHRHLSTLYNLRYVSRQHKKYQLGLRALRLGQASRTRDPLYQMTESHVRDLAKKTGERCQFLIEDHGLGVYIYMETGDQAVRVAFDIGRQIHLHCSSAGKALLAHYPRERVDSILDRWGLPEYTEHTITERNELYNELDKVRDRGYAINREEHVYGLKGVAVPIRKNDNEILGVLSVAVPSHRLKGERLEETIPNLLLGSANELELNMAYSDAGKEDDVVVE